MLLEVPTMRIFSMSVEADVIVMNAILEGVDMIVGMDILSRLGGVIVDGNGVRPVERGRPEDKDRPTREPRRVERSAPRPNVSAGVVTVKSMPTIVDKDFEATFEEGTYMGGKVALEG
jgi:hypothetical protein